MALFAALTMLLLVSRSLSDNQSAVCRVSSEGKNLLRREEFRSLSCAQCFFYTYAHPEAAYKNRYIFIPCVDGILVCDFPGDPIGCDCETGVQPRYNLPEYALTPQINSNYSVLSLADIPLEPSPPHNYLAVTKACCRAADECCHQMIKEHTEHYAERQCLGQGKWFSIYNIRTQELNDWTDYSKCVTVNFPIYIKFLIGIFSFLLSAIAIIPALFIFSFFRALKIESNAIHTQLLISFLLTAVFYIFNGLFFTLEGSPGERLTKINHISCRIMFSIQLRYLRLTNYSWMLCEGWYLHRLLVAAFADHDTLLSYYFLGWGFPLIPLILYSVLRAVMDDSGCWLGPTLVTPWIEWISYSPCLCCLIINVVLMVSIVVILVRKLRYEHSEFEPVHYRKAVRATVMLLPVFGAHFFITIYPAKFFAYEVLNVLLDGLQGFFVVLIVCYSNHKVLETLKKRWKEYRDKRQIMEESIIHQRSYHRYSVALQFNDTGPEHTL